MNLCVHDSTAYYDDSTIELVVFRAAGYRFGVEAVQVRSSEKISGQPTDTIEALLGLPAPATGAARQAVTISGNSRQRILSIASPLELQVFQVDSIHPLPRAIALRSALPGLKALALTADGIILIVSLASLLSDEALLNGSPYDATDRCPEN